MTLRDLWRRQEPRQGERSGSIEASIQHAKFVAGEAAIEAVEKVMKASGDVNLAALAAIDAGLDAAIAAIDPTTLIRGAVDQSRVAEAKRLAKLESAMRIGRAIVARVQRGMGPQGMNPREFAAILGPEIVGGVWSAVDLYVDKLRG